SLGTGTGAQAINLGTGGTGAKTVTLGSSASTGTTTINAGSGGITLGAAATLNSTLSVTGASTLRGLTVNNATATDDQIATTITTGGAARFTGTITNADLTAARTYTLPDATGTFCLTSGNCAGVGGTGDILNNGQAGAITIGTNDATALNLETTDIVRLTVTSGGDVNIVNNLQTGGTTRLSNAGVLSNVTNADASTFFTGGSLSVARGGTGAGTFTTNGILYGNGTGAIGVTAAGTTGQCLIATTGSAPTWNTCTGDGVGDSITINSTAATDANFLNTAATAAVAGTTFAINTVSNPDDITLTVSDASATLAGIVTANAQTFGGDKTFTGTLTVTGLTTLNGGLTVETGDTFTFNADAFTDFTGGGLINSGGVLTVDNSTAAGFFQQGGNSFAGTAILGTNDAFGLSVETNNIVRASFANSDILYLGNADPSTGLAASPNAFSVLGTSNSTAAGVGGAVTLQAGAGNTSGAGGLTTVNGGVAGATGIGGGVTIRAGAGGSTSGVGGAVTIASGAGTAGSSASGAVNISTANAIGVSNSGSINLTVGQGLGQGNINLATGQFSGTYGNFNIGTAGGRTQLGTATSNAKLSVVNVGSVYDADSTILGQSSGTQTGNLLTLRNNALTNLFVVDISGNTSVAGNLTVDTNTLFVDATNNTVGIGANGASAGKLEVNGAPGGTDTTIASIKGTTTSTTTQSALFTNLTVSPSGAANTSFVGVSNNLSSSSVNLTGATSQLVGTLSTTSYSAAATTINTIYGNRTFSDVTGSANGTLITGIQAVSRNTGSGTVTYSIGTAGQVIQSGAGTTTSAYGFYGWANSASAGTLTNSVGLGLDNQAAGGNNTNLLISSTNGFVPQTSGAGNWSIYNASTYNNAFAGNFRVGGLTAPTVALDVTGAALISTTLGVTGLTTLNGGLTVETGDTFTFNADAFTDFTGGGLINSGGVLTVDNTVLDNSFFIQDGNTFGATATLGTVDANILSFETTNVSRFQIAAGASTLTGQGATTLTSTAALTLSSAAASTIGITTGTTGALTLDTGTTGAINIGTNANAKTVTIGNGTGATSVVINAGTGALDIGT
ncbi:MAG: beta strand repeat-containing protein, partial [Solirubrobacterales bacterium]